jgi:hypothetical protein
MDSLIILLLATCNVGCICIHRYDDVTLHRFIGSWLLDCLGTDDV